MLLCGELHLCQHPAGVRPPEQPRHAPRADHGVTLDTAYLSCDMLSCPGGYRVQRSPNTTRSVFTHISFKLSNRIDST